MPIKLHDGVWAYRPPSKDQDEVVLLFGQSALLLGAKQYDELIPLLEGSLTKEEIVQELDGIIDEAEVRLTLAKLSQRRFVHDIGPTDEGTMSALGLDGVKVGLQVFGSFAPHALVACLEGKGAILSEDASEVAITLVLTDHYLRPELEAFNKSAKAPWMLMGPSGHDMWFGPVFVPDLTACWECLAHRLRLNRRVEQFIWSQTGSAQISGEHSVLNKEIAPVAFELAAAKLGRWLSGSVAKELEDTLHVLGQQTLSTTKHGFVRRPQCPACRTSELPDPEPVLLNVGQKAEEQGTATSPVPEVSPDDQREAEALSTLGRYGDLVSPITGLLSDFAKRTDAPGIHIFRGGRFGSKTPKHWDGLQASLDEYAAGKGVTEAQAKASALAETLEWHTLGATANCKLIEGAYNSLSASERILRPDELVFLSERQLADAEASEQCCKHSSSNGTRRFDPDATLKWRAVWSVTKKEWVYVPAAFCGWHETAPYVPSDSNGAAAGVSKEHATLHAFNELIERDAIALWWYNRAARPGVDLDGLDPAFLAAMDGYQHSLGREYWLLDITSDFQLPSYVAVSVDENGQAASRGYGVHSDPHQAAMRALTELNQLLPISGQFVPRSDRPSPNQLKLREVVDDHMLPAANAPKSHVDLIAPSRTRDVIEDLHNAIERTHSLGMEFLVADMTQPDIGLPVMKVIVPGARRAYPEFGPGRLYDVPVKLGWRDGPITEAEVSQMLSPM